MKVTEKLRINFNRSILIKYESLLPFVMYMYRVGILHYIEINISVEKKKTNK